jgi:hypothetical protein
MNQSALEIDSNRIVRTAIICADDAITQRASQLANEWFVQPAYLDTGGCVRIIVSVPRALESLEIVV